MTTLEKPIFVLLAMALTLACGMLGCSTTTPAPEPVATNAPVAVKPKPLPPMPTVAVKSNAAPKVQLSAPQFVAAPPPVQNPLTLPWWVVQMTFGDNGVITPTAWANGNGPQIGALSVNGPTNIIYAFFPMAEQPEYSHAYNRVMFCQCSVDLKSWSTIGQTPNYPNADFFTTFTNLASLNLPAFYRLGVTPVTP